MDEPNPQPLLPENWTHHDYELLKAVLLKKPDPIFEAGRAAVEPDSLPEDPALPANDGGDTATEAPSAAAQPNIGESPSR